MACGVTISSSIRGLARKVLAVIPEAATVRWACGSRALSAAKVAVAKAAEPSGVS